MLKHHESWSEGDYSNSTQACKKYKTPEMCSCEIFLEMMAFKEDMLIFQS